MPATPWKMPPIVKVYEALGAIGDGRVRIEDARRATVISSDLSKKYEVETSLDGREISSNDNASYWQGYLGYPSIAVLLAREFYRPPANITDALAGVAWKELNRKYKNDYAKTIAEVEDRNSKRAGTIPTPCAQRPRRCSTSCASCARCVASGVVLRRRNQSRS